ncbi:MAG: helix-turn-helix domain-containing protein [Roseomonas sp.]|nr:helix-turn-helix domain-containing protein [Roseomonas sp.]
MDRPILSISDHRAQVGNRLDAALRAIPLDQVQAAEIMGVSKQSVTDWIKGRGYPPTYGCYRLHKMTGITYDWLFLGDWGALPARLAEKLQPDLSALLAPATATERQEAGTDSPT